MGELEREIRGALRGAVFGAVEERIGLATGIILRAVGAVEPADSWLPSSGETLSDLVAERIVRWRKERGLSREQLAGECARRGAPGLTVESFANIESGRRKNGVRRRMVTIDEVAVIASALGISPLLLVQGGGAHVSTHKVTVRLKESKRDGGSP